MPADRHAYYLAHERRMRGDARSPELERLLADVWRRAADAALDPEEAALAPRSAFDGASVWTGGSLGLGGAVIVTSRAGAGGPRYLISALAPEELVRAGELLAAAPARAAA